MSQSIRKFNSLTGNVSIDEIKDLEALAKKEGQTRLSERLAQALEAAKKFDLVSFKPGAYAIEEIPSFDLPGLEALPNYISAEEFTGLNKAVSPDDIYQYITDLVLNTIEKVGNLPWQTTWEKTGFSDGKQATNFESKKGYRGINFFLLNFEVKQDEDGQEYMEQINFENPYFLTFKQIEKFNGKLKKGSKGKRVVYFTKLYSHSEVQEDGTKLEFSTYNKKKFIAWIEKHKSKLKILTRPGWTVERLSNNYIPILKYYNVFNAGDITGIDWGILPKNENATKSEKEKIEIAEAIIEAMPNPPKVNFGGNQPAYYPKTDSILIPEIDKFHSPQEYYSTFFHELIHSTGHGKRLSRPGVTLGKLKSKLDYAKEELIAEMGAVFLCAESGILFHIIDNSAKYLKGWNSRLVKSMKEDNRFYFRAASASQAAADYMLDRDKNGNPAYLKTIRKPNKKKLSKKELEKANPAPKSVKPKSISVASAIDDILGLDKYKGISKIQANILYKYFKDDIGLEFDENGESITNYDITKPFEFGNLKKETDYHFLYEYDEKQGYLYLSVKGFELVQSIKNRLESKRNQKNNYALFDGLASPTAKTPNSIAFNKEVLKAKKAGKFTHNKAYNLGSTNDITKEKIGDYLLSVSGAALNKAMVKDGDHIATFEHFINLPDSINKPIAIFKSKTKNNSFVVLTELKNYKQKPLIAAIHLNDVFKIIKIASVYSRKNTDTFSKWNKEGLAVYINKKAFNPLLSGTIPVSQTAKGSRKNTKTKPKSKNNGLKSPETQLIEPKTNAGDQSIGGSSRPPISGKTLKASDIANMQFETLPLDEGWENLFQTAPKNMRIAVWAKPKNGKTAACCTFASYLTKFGPILYNFADQGINLSTKKLIEMSGLDKKENAYITTSDTLEELVNDIEATGAQHVFIDMINQYINNGVTPHHFKKEILQRFPNIGFTLIMEVTKSGNFKGDQSWTHLVDQLVTLDNYIMDTKGRYGTGEKISWDEGAKKYNPARYAEIKESLAPIPSSIPEIEPETSLNETYDFVVY